MAMSRWQAKLERKQAVLGRLVDVGAELFAISATVVYATTMAREQPERADQAAELADLFCRQSRRRIDTLFAGLWANDDDQDYGLAQQTLKGRYTWLEEGIIDPSGDGADDRRAARVGDGRVVLTVGAGGAGDWPRGCPPYYRSSTNRRADSIRLSSSKVSRPTVSPRRLGSIAAVCSASTRVVRSEMTTSGRKLAGRAELDVGATSHVDNGS